MKHFKLIILRDTFFILLIVGVLFASGMALLSYAYPSKPNITQSLEPKNQFVNYTFEDVILNYTDMEFYVHLGQDSFKISIDTYTELQNYEAFDYFSLDLVNITEDGNHLWYPDYTKAEYSYTQVNDTVWVLETNVEDYNLKIYVYGTEDEFTETLEININNQTFIYNPGLTDPTTVKYSYYRYIQNTGIKLFYNEKNQIVLIEDHGYYLT